MKKLFSMLFVMLMLIALPLLQTDANAVEGDGWSLDESTGVLTITKDLLRAEWNDYRDLVKKVVYAETEGDSFVTFTEIPNYMFYGYPNLEEVVLPPYLKYIRRNAFEACTALKTVNIPEMVELIEPDAFKDCTALENVNFSDSDKLPDGPFMVIRYGAFMNCTALQSVDLPVRCAILYGEAFSGCTSLQSVSMTKQMSVILDDTFYGTDLQHVYYEGTEAQWKEIDIHESNDEIFAAKIHYNSGPFKFFGDVGKTEYYYEPVKWAVEQGVTTGTTELTFSPEDFCTRGQVVTFLWRAVGEPAPAGREHAFTDLAEGAYYYDAVLWAVEQGITAGTSATTFSPEAFCTRGQVVTFLWRLRGQEDMTRWSNAFVDVAKDDYFYMPTLWACMNGITRGTDPNHFSPDDICTRGQVVTFLHRDSRNAGIIY